MIKFIYYKKIVPNIEQNGTSIKYSFEKIPFRCNGLISCAEIVKIFDNFYIYTKERIDEFDIMHR